MSDKVNNLFFVASPQIESVLACGPMSFVLRPSAISGVGVFTTHGIRSGARLPLFPHESVFIPKGTVDPGSLLESFCLMYTVEVDNGYYAPQDFNAMDIGWYLNHSDTPNAYHDEDFNFFALKDIAAGEEIVIDYRRL